MSQDACYFVDEPPEFDYKDGLFHITFEVAGKRIERVMRPHVFMLALRRAAECAKAHRFGGAAIIDFPSREEDAAAG